MAACIIVSQTPKWIMLQGQRANDWDRTTLNRPFPRARREFGTSIAPCLWLPFNRGTFVYSVSVSVSVHGHFTRRTMIFRFKSMGEEKWTAGQGHKAEPLRCNLSYFIFPQWGAIPLDGLQKGEKRKTEERIGTWKLYFRRTQSLGSVKKLTTSPY